MSNASNLSTLANILDDGSDGQFLKSTGSGGVAFDTVAAGATVYSSASDLPLTGNTVGDMAYVSAATTAKVVNQTTGSVSTEDATRLYIYSGTGWYSVAFITQNPTISTVQDAGGGSTPFTLATDGTTSTVVTITADDPESVPLTYSYSVTGGSLNGCTITGADGTSARVAGTAYTDNVFTVTPHASNEATFTLTFTASDGINQATSANAFSLTFITNVTDSNHTALLATATGTSDNDNITYIDGSGNSQNFTVTGSVTAGTFSPYRSGGYSTFFNTATSQNAKIDLPTTVFNSYSTSNASTSNFTIQAMIYPTGYADTHSWGNSYAMAVFAKGNVRVNLGINSSGYLIFHHYGTSANDIVGSSQVPLNEWSHVAIICTNGSLSLKLNGTQVGTSTWTGVVDPSGSVYVGAHNYTSLGSSSSLQTGDNGYFKGYIADFKISGVAETITAAPTERAVSDSNTQLLLCHLPYIVDGSSNSVLVTPDDVSTKPFSPYDYPEYDAADHGGSVYFDASNYATISNFNQSITGNFTVECWVYVTGSNAGDDTFLKWGNLRFRSNNDSAVRDVANIGGFMSVGSGNTHTPNRWVHVVLDRSGNTLKAYKNGINFYHNTNYTASQVGHSGDLYLGWDGSSEKFIGYISDLRIVSESLYGSYGTSTSAANFNLPTAPLASNSNAILHFKGTDASIIDKSQGSNLKLVGNTTGSTTTKFTGAKSMYFDGNGDYADITIEPIGAGDFTVEFWVNDDGSGDSAQQEFGGYLSLASSGSQSTGIFFSRYNFMVGGNSTDWGSAFPNTFTATHGTGWSHIAMCRSGTTVKVYVDGTLEHTVTGISADLTNTDLRIASRWNDNTSYLCPCYIQDLRISKGKARYTAADETSNIPSAPLEG